MSKQQQHFGILAMPRNHLSGPRVKTCPPHPAQVTPLGAHSIEQSVQPALISLKLYSHLEKIRNTALRDTKIMHASMKLMNRQKKVKYLLHTLMQQQQKGNTQCVCAYWTGCCGNPALHLQEATEADHTCG